MGLINNTIYCNDICRCLSFDNMSFLKDKTVFITGGTGLIGSAIVDLVLYNNKINNNNTTIIIASRIKKSVLERFGENPYVKWVEYDALKPIDFDFSFDYAIHCAGIASPELYISKAVETILISICGLNNLLEYIKNQNCKKFVFVSSSEVYGLKTQKDAYSENDYGYIDILKERSSYSNSKRAAETLCFSYYSEYGINTSIVRPGHIYGPTASSKDMRVSSNFAYLASQGVDLELKSPGNQIRSYMYCLDCARAILKVLNSGKCGEAYNICGKEVASIREISEYIAEAGNVELKFNLPNNQERVQFNPMDNSSLNGEKLFSLGFDAIFSIKEGFEHTVKILKMLNN